MQWKTTSGTCDTAQRQKASTMPSPPCTTKKCLTSLFWRGPDCTRSQESPTPFCWTSTSLGESGRALTLMLNRQITFEPKFSTLRDCENHICFIIRMDLRNWQLDVFARFWEWLWTVDRSNSGAPLLNEVMQFPVNNISYCVCISFCICILIVFCIGLSFS